MIVGTLSGTKRSSRIFGVFSQFFYKFIKQVLYNENLSFFFGLLPLFRHKGSHNSGKLWGSRNSENLGAVKARDEKKDNIFYFYKNYNFFKFKWIKNDQLKFFWTFIVMKSLKVLQSKFKSNNLGIFFYQNATIFWAVRRNVGSIEP